MSRFLHTPQPPCNPTSRKKSSGRVLTSREYIIQMEEREAKKLRRRSSTIKEACKKEREEKKLKNAQLKEERRIAREEKKLKTAQRKEEQRLAREEKKKQRVNYNCYCSVSKKAPVSTRSKGHQSARRGSSLRPEGVPPTDFVSQPEGVPPTDSVSQRTRSKNPVVIL